MSEAIGLGSVVWWRDPNCRVYAKDEKGRSVGGPIERGYWRAATVVGESPRMWLLSSFAPKLPKSGKVPAVLATSIGAVDRAVWLAENKHAIEGAVHRITWGVVVDSEAAFAKMKAIAEIVGFEPKPPSGAGEKG